MSKQRKREGYRTHLATFIKHNGNVDADGNPTYTNEADWIPEVANWPVEVIGARGAEVIRGRAVAAETTHVLFGEFFGGEGIEATHICLLSGHDQRFGVVSSLDQSGDRRERRVEIREGA